MYMNVNLCILIHYYTIDFEIILVTKGTIVQAKTLHDLLPQPFNVSIIAGSMPSAKMFTIVQDLHVNVPLLGKRVFSCAVFSVREKRK
jgi:hypothetical protein